MRGKKVKRKKGGGKFLKFGVECRFYYSLNMVDEMNAKCQNGGSVKGIIGLVSTYVESTLTIIHFV